MGGGDSLSNASDNVGIPLTFDILLLVLPPTNKFLLRLRKHNVSIGDRETGAEDEGSTGNVREAPRLSCS